MPAGELATFVQSSLRGRCGQPWRSAPASPAASRQDQPQCSRTSCMVEVLVSWEPRRGLPALAFHPPIGDEMCALAGPHRRR